MTSWHHLFRGKNLLPKKFERKIKKDIGEIPGEISIQELREKFIPDRADLYMFSGFFTEDIDGEVKIAASGYLFGEEGKTFEGEMIDIYGPSEIEGVIYEDDIFFKKSYILKKKPDKINFKLKHSHKGYYRGFYYFEKDKTVEGKADFFLKRTDIKERIVTGPPKPRNIVEDFYKLA